MSEFLDKSLAELKGNLKSFGSKKVNKQTLKNTSANVPLVKQNERISKQNIVSMLEKGEHNNKTTTISFVVGVISLSILGTIVLIVWFLMFKSQKE